MINFTFVFLTKNRKDIFESLNSCLQINSDEINAKVVIVDGNKTNLIDQSINKLKHFEDKIKIIKQKKGKFMRSCILGVQELKTNYFTFMYDDDLLHKDFQKLIKIAAKEKCFVFSNGAGNLKKNIPLDFTNTNIHHFKSEEIKDHFINYKKFKDRYFPVTPICSVFSSQILEEWLELIQLSLKKRIFAYYLMKKNIGPDLLLYLLSVLRNKKIIYVNLNIAQFTAHKNSMTVVYGQSNCRIGYWLARKLILEKYNKEFKKNKIFNLKLFYKGIVYFVLQTFNKNKFKQHKSIIFLREVFSIYV